MFDLIIPALPVQPRCRVRNKLQVFTVPVILLLNFDGFHNFFGGSILRIEAVPCFESGFLGDVSRIGGPEVFEGLHLADSRNNRLASVLVFAPSSRASTRNSFACIFRFFQTRLRWVFVH